MLYISIRCRACLFAFCAYCIFSDEGVRSALNAVEKKIGGKGRALIRESGTEPVIRIMVECENEEKCKEYADIIAEAVAKGGHNYE